MHPEKDNPILQVDLDRPSYTKNETIKGTLTLKTLSPIYIHKIELKLFKEFEYKINSEKLRKRKSSDKIYLLYENPLDFSELSIGSHTFPFEIKIVKDVKGTVSSLIHFGQNFYSVKNQIFLEAVVYKDKSAENVCSKKVEVNFYELVKKNRPVLFNMEFTYCFCLLHTESKLEISLDKDFYYAGECINLSVNLLKNNKIIKIKSLFVEMYQNMQLQSDNQFYKEKKLLFKTKGYVDTLKNKYCADIRIPFSVPNNVFESYLSLYNHLEINITFDRSSPIMLRKNVYVVKNTINLPNLSDESVIQGVTLPKCTFKY